jgi:predicted negative regulator of RcsB-dependent stress response
MRLLIVLFTISCFLYSPYALSQQINCDRENHTCHYEALLQTVKDIENTKWKDQTYKDVSVLLTSSNQPLKALKTLNLISNPDTKAMAIRACAKVVAEHDSYKKNASQLFEQLITSADSIEHPPSKAIAYTYIAIAQAEYGAFPNALNTASLMHNESLKNKALAEISKIMAQRNQFNETIEALSSIQSEHYRDKTSLSISKIYSENNQYDEAMKIMSMIHNPYQKSQSLLAIIKNLSLSTRQE